MKILFLCVENSARSQMAEGIAKKVLGEIADIQSAGSNPSKVHSLAIKVMAEEGIDISDQRSKAINEINLSDIDWIITLCNEEVCPYIGGNIKKLHWPLPNPTNSFPTTNQQIEKFRGVRDQLIQLITEFKKRMR